MKKVIRLLLVLVALVVVTLAVLPDTLPSRDAIARVGSVALLAAGYLWAWQALGPKRLKPEESGSGLHPAESSMRSPAPSPAESEGHAEASEVRIEESWARG